jgi:hypothetical protein
MFEIRRTSESVFPYQPAALSCIAMVVSTLAAFIARGLWVVSNDREGELPLAILGLAAMMTVWSASVIVIVFWPIMEVVRSITHGSKKAWMFSAAGIVALPVAVIGFIAVSKVIPGNERPFAEQWSFVVQHPLAFAPLLVGFGAGGLVFGYLFGTSRGAVPVSTDA